MTETTTEQLRRQVLDIVGTLECPPLVDAERPEDGPLQDQSHHEAYMHVDFHGEEFWLDENKKDISARIRGEDYVFDKEDDLWKYGDGSEVDAVPMSAHDFLTDALSLEYTCDSKREYLGGEVLVCWGGPNIWIDTRRNVVAGAWGSDKFEASYSDNIGLDDALSELWECSA